MFSLLIIGVPSSCTTTAPTPIQTLTPTATPQVPLRAALPFSFERDSLKITVLGMIPVENEHGYVLEGYQQWMVNVKFQNLLKEDWPPEGMHVTCTGFSGLKLKTDRGNLYNPRFIGGLSICGTLRPEAAVTFGEENIFEIRKDETPIELWAYLEVQGESQLTYIFALSVGSASTAMPTSTQTSTPTIAATSTTTATVVKIVDRDIRDTRLGGDSL